ncbi:MAG: 30S ribosomal protein S6 [Candidatus Levybacteria bacterium]|nr:30S ribosomal protein S6 [Candidatus Levybacteria bacterium]
MTRKYRLVLILKSDLKKEAKEKLLSQVKTWSGKISNDKISELGEKKFAYPVKGNQKGDYVLFEFESVSVSAELEDKVHIHDDVLRHLLVRN